MMRAALFAAALLLGACDQDKLPDDLSQVEGNAVAEEVNLAEEAEPEPPAPVEVENVVEEEPAPDEEPSDSLAPTDSNPSFDCSAATNRVERHICDVPELGALDRRVAAAFDDALDEATPEQSDRLRNLGRQYISDRNRCRDDYCIRQAYRWYERDIYVVMGWQGPN